MIRTNDAAVQRIKKVAKDAEKLLTKAFRLLV